MPPITMLIKPASSACNMRCSYCFYSDVSDRRESKSYGFMSEETLEKLVRKALDYADNYCSFGFQGGEPTLAGIEFYKKLVKFQKIYNRKNVPIYNSIQTNGYEMTEEFAAFLAENRFLVGISVDGTEETHNMLRIDAQGNGTYSRIMETIQLLDRNKVEYNILCVVNKHVAERPAEVYKNLKKYKFLQFIPCIDPFDAPKADYSLSAKEYGNFLIQTFRLYYKYFMRGQYVSVRNFDNYIGVLLGRPAENCGMNGVCNCYFLIEGDGSTYPCDFYVLDEWKMGNVNTDSFQRMLKSEKAKTFIECSRPVDPKCKECSWFSICRGGCRRDREPFADGIPALNKYCESYRMFFNACYDQMCEVIERINNLDYSSN